LKPARCESRWLRHDLVETTALRNFLLACGAGNVISCIGNRLSYVRLALKAVTFYHCVGFGWDRLNAMFRPTFIVVQVAGLAAASGKLVNDQATVVPVDRAQ
jgi:hypothetical protein